MSKAKLFVVLVILGLSIFSTQFFSQTPLWEMPNILTAMRAKEYCTCHFLIGKDDQYCRKVISKGYPFIGSEEINTKEKYVRFTMLGYTNMAKLINSRTGCLLMP
jgi:hypothetical protein